jgi:holo-[acyl-carrier protein] synthase
LKKGDFGILKTVFSDDEINYCLAKRHPLRHFAVRFAGKEAFLKALGTGLRGEISLAEIQFYNDNFGKPCLKCVGVAKTEIEKRNIVSMQVSFSHSGNNVVAFVLLEDK